jgi:hypothetical protein
MCGYVQNSMSIRRIIVILSSILGNARAYKLYAKEGTHWWFSEEKEVAFR